MLMLITYACYACYAFGLVFTICDLGQRSSNAFDEIADFIWQTQWYLHSKKIQQLLPTIMIAVQKPVEFKFFGSLSCNRKSLEKVVSPYRERKKNHLKYSNRFKLFSGIQNQLFVFHGASRICEIKPELLELK